jgi:NADPH:quinone reductase-like Zn-dependent oxidoreductase
MKQIWIPRPGPPRVLEVREAPDPTPGPGEVRIAVQAAGVNFADLMARAGAYPDAPPIPSVVGYEVAGVVDAVGEGVDAARIGEPVLALCRFGGYSTHRCVPTGQAVRRPEALGPVDAAAIPVNYLTAWMMLRIFTQPQPGDRVLVHSAAGGVGLAAIDLLRGTGAEVWGRAGTSKHEFLLARGYHHLIDSRSDVWPEEKLDIILDSVGGGSWARGLDQLRAGGRLVCFGFSTSAGETRSLWATLRAGLAIPWFRVNPITLMNDNKAVLGVNMGHLWDEAERVSGWVRQLVALQEAGAFQPHVHAVVPFSRAAEAHQMLHDRVNIGKVVLVPD